MKNLTLSILTLALVAMITSAGLSDSVMAAPEQGAIPMFGCYRIITMQAGASTVTVESDAFLANGAKVVSRTYDFGDGTSVTTNEPGGAPVTHTYQEVGRYRITVTFYFNVNGRIRIVSDSGCQSTFAATAPSTHTIAAMAHMLACSVSSDTSCRETIAVP